MQPECQIFIEMTFSKRVSVSLCWPYDLSEAQHYNGSQYKCLAQSRDAQSISKNLMFGEMEGNKESNNENQIWKS